jgi:4a-hydroxytetrahydrobiopterin dehydratase
VNAAKAALLDDNQLEDSLAHLPDWTLEDGKLHRSFRFDNFGQTMGFMVRVAMIAEKMEHHPAWSGVYTSMELYLDTHEVGGITNLDVDLAARIDGLLSG